ncbi:MAG: hypothetical protein ACREUT_12855, partial [Steroidobacteraceae bacterium]
GAARPYPAGALALRAAAAIVLVAGAAALAAWIGGGPARRGDSQPLAHLSTGERQEPSGETPIDPRDRALERWLARQPAEPAMVRVGAYATEATLEDRIAQLDDLLTTARAEGVQSAGLSPLEEQRVRLVSSLARVRFAETLVADSPR